MKKLAMALLVAAFGVNTGFAQDIKREISRVTADVYRFQNQYHMNMFVITGAGVVVTDPINEDAAKWLRAEIARITDEPITHLIYSHSHGDHASGGTGYGEVPNVITHRNAPEDIDLVEPTIRFDDQMSLGVGDKTIELTYLGPGHGNDLIAMVVRPDDVGFVVDAVSARRLFYRDFPGANVDHWMDQVRKVDALDFDLLIGGHGPVGVKRDVGQGLAYLEELRAAVLAGLRAGKSVDELKASVKMEKYGDWEAYDSWRELNVEGMARHLAESGALQ
ncbi:MAG: MBL fold metallo-hydrolase [Gammaproteobacteria bacterium]|nr:MBL fold metallo-hydrolase [Gammaproteobacteria bacterium]MDH3534578.1 MBL fold metallo-hydrolase [Gammaproteobacteria bacterium]